MTMKKIGNLQPNIRLDNSLSSNKQSVRIQESIRSLKPGSANPGKPPELAHNIFPADLPVASQTVQPAAQASNQSSNQSGNEPKKLS